MHDYREMAKQVQHMKKTIKKKDPESLYKDKINERKKQIKAELLKLYDLSLYSTWNIQHENGIKKESLSLEGVYLDIINYACDSFDKDITPISVIKISKGNIAKKIDADSLKNKTELLKKKNLLEEELKKINEQLLKYE